DPAEFEAVLGDEVELLGDPCSCLAGEFVEFLRFSGDEKHSIAIAESELDADGPCPLGTDILGDRTGAALFAPAPEDIGQARLALGLRPGVHTVAEGTRAAAPDGDRPYFDFGIGGDQPGKHLEARTREMPGHVLHLDRLAQIWLVGAIFADRIAVGD